MPLVKEEGSPPAEVSCLRCTKLLGDLSMPEFSCAERADDSVFSPRRAVRRINQHSLRDAQTPLPPRQVFLIGTAAQPRSPITGHGSAVPCAGMAPAPGRPWLSQKHKGIKGSCLCYLGTFLLHNIVRVCGYSCGCLRVLHICVTVFQQ